MRAVVQRVARARVSVADEEVGAIGSGLCVLVGVTHTDGEAEARKLADKVWGLRVFDDDEGVMNVSAADAGAEVLGISQCHALRRRPRASCRPSRSPAARPRVPSRSSARGGRRTAGGGARRRHRSLPGRHAGRAVNDGPVTLVLDV